MPRTDTSPRAATAYERAVAAAPRDGDIYFLSLYKLGWSYYNQATQTGQAEYSKAVEVFGRLIEAYDKLTPEQQARLGLRSGPSSTSTRTEHSSRSVRSKRVSSSSRNSVRAPRGPRRIRRHRATARRPFASALCGRRRNTRSPRPNSVVIASATPRPHRSTRATSASSRSRTARRP